MNTTSATGVAGWIPDASAQPPVTRVDEARVAAFIAAHKLEPWVDAAIRLARDAFPDAKRIALEMFGAPGEYGESLFVDVITNAGGDTLIRQYDDYVKRWIAATPPWVTDLLGISTHPE
jgi:hypothetical protein